uniref:Uncharacterized protein n=1 Tax=Timema cristinae TaxID=61476 RepID=A0A7R9HDS0_TIMCR|nr:unnamed protein product [Timema cristinae]
MCLQTMKTVTTRVRPSATRSDDEKRTPRRNRSGGMPSRKATTLYKTWSPPANKLTVPGTS